MAGVDPLSPQRDPSPSTPEAFDAYIARPLQANLAKKSGHDLAKRNPLIYTVRGATTVEGWVDRALEDWETSAIEGHLGTWMEEVARIVSGGFKPGSGVDLQIDREGTSPVVELYACQSAGNTKSSGGRRSDVDALRRAAGAIRASRRHVEEYIAVMHGRGTTAVLGSDPSITVLGSDDFWHKVSGVPDFRARLLQASTVLSTLIAGRAAAEVARIKTEAQAIFGDAAGNLRVDMLANPPRRRRATS